MSTKPMKIHRRAKPTLSNEEARLIDRAFMERAPKTYVAKHWRRHRGSDRPWPETHQRELNRADYRARGQHGAKGGPRLYIRKAKVISAAERTR